MVVGDDDDSATLVKKALQRDGFNDVFAFTESFVSVGTL